MWFIAVVALTGAIGRGAKALWSTMGSLTLYAIVLSSGYLLLFGDLALDTSAPIADDARLALWGVLLSPLAIAGHEIAKKILVGVLSFIPGVTPERATAIAEVILGKLEEKATPPPAPPTKKGAVVIDRILGVNKVAEEAKALRSTAKRTTQTLLVMLGALALLGCARPLDTAILASNANAASLKATHAQLLEQRRADQLEAAKAVEGPRGDAAVVAAQLRAAREVGERYRPAWKAYEGARFAWLRLVAAIQLVQANPGLLSVSSLAGLVSELVAARTDLEAFALDAMRGGQALRKDAPPPAPGAVSP